RRPVRRSHYQHDSQYRLALGGGMDTLNGASPASLAEPLAIVLVALLLPLAWRAIRAPHLPRIGMRNVVRQRIRTLLILFGLMLSTPSAPAARRSADTLVPAVKSVAVSAPGRIDEEVRGGTGPPGLSPATLGDTLHNALSVQPHVA